MATHPSILAWRIPLDRGAWRAAVHGVKELDMTEQVSVKYDLAVVLMCIFLMTLDVKHLFKFFFASTLYQESVKTTAIPP